MTPYLPQVSSHRSQNADWTELSHSQLIESLGSLTRARVFQEGSLSAALAVARLMDRGRIARSGLSPEAIERALRQYREATGWTPIPAIERALEQAAAISQECVATRAAATSV